jgi:hypothetical protein
MRCATLPNPRAIQEPMSLRPQGSLAPDRQLEHDTGRDLRQSEEVESFVWAS